MRPRIGDTVTCCETGKQFVVEAQGGTLNCAYSSDGRIWSDEGVDLAEKRELKERSAPFVGYISQDGKHLTGWKGNILGDVIASSTVRLPRWSYTHGKHVIAYRIKDVHGGLWYGRGSPSVCIRLRPTK